MKKKLKFLISILLIITLAVSSFTVPVSSYEHDVNISSPEVLLLNLDTNTVCFAIEPDRRRFASYMSELATFIVAVESIPAPEQKKITVTQDFLDELPYSDGSLDRFVGKVLTAKDLLAIMLLSSGSDAAYLLAETVCPGDTDAFVEKMNERLARLGCSRTRFLTPGYCISNEHYTTCNDIARMFKFLYSVDLYHEIMSSPTYIPPGYEAAPTGGANAAGDSLSENQPKQPYEIVTECSILNPDSPYYFKYATSGKFSYDPVALANLMVSTTYRGKSYLFVAMKGLDTAEQNVFADARRLATWAYLNLSDRKVVDNDAVISTCTVSADWGSYEIELFADDSAYKTLPTKYEAEKISYKLSVPKTTLLPIYQGQVIGTAKIYYDGTKIDDVNLVPAKSEGFSLLNDLSRFGLYAFSEILSNEPPIEAAKAAPEMTAAEPTAAPTASPTAAPTEAPDEEQYEEQSSYDYYEPED